MKQRTLFDDALDYADRGWPTIPVIGKVAAVPWKQYQTEKPSRAAMRTLFSGSAITGLALILGNGVACRDFDLAASYWNWAQKQPLLAGILPTVQTARGFHVYFAGPNGFQVLDDGEYRADAKHYTLLPPSRHPSGIIYEWMVPLPNGQLPSINPISVGLSRAETASQDTKDTQATHVSAGQSNLENVILKYVPICTGKRNSMLFDLARHLKALMPDSDKDTLRPIIKQWHARALPYIGKKEWSLTWGDFIGIWQRIKCPLGSSWPVIVASAKRMPVEEHEDLSRDAMEMVNLFRALQAHHGRGKQWPLSCRLAASVIGVGRTHAARLIKLLAFEGFIELVRPAGPKGSRIAAEYRMLEKS